MEDTYLDAYEALLLRSEYAAAERGKRFDFDGAAWAISIISSAITLIANGFLEAWGETLAESLKSWLRKIARPSPQRVDHADNTAAIEDVRRIVVEIKGTIPRGDLIDSLEPSITTMLQEEGLDEASVRSLTSKILALISDDPDQRDEG